ncbi:Rap1a/Tai family immunity protein [Sphingobium aromaticiconvertens]|uniref:Rap1a/Tai family immunity protein n=1 Tax=Sphingobium aromaticiconvertens TaxID=365341 RepID=UPI0030195409
MILPAIAFFSAVASLAADQVPSAPLPPQPLSSPPLSPPSSPPRPAPGQSAGENGYLTANDLAKRCNDSSPAAISYCYAYVAAVHDTMKAYEIWLGEKEFCINGGNAQSDLRRAFLTYLTAYPQNGGGQAASVVAVALKQTYVCSVPSAPAPAPAPDRKAENPKP